MQKFYDYDPANPFKVSGETQVITDGKIRLNYTPLAGSLTITGYTATTENSPGTEEFYVDYQTASSYRLATQFVYFNTANNGKTVTCNYSGVSTLILARHLNEIKEFMESGTAPNATVADHVADALTFRDVDGTTRQFNGSLPVDLSTGVNYAASAGKAINDVNGKAITATYAPLTSPALTGTPTAPTATADTKTTQVATTAFVNTAVSQGNSATATKLVTARSIGLTGLIEGTAKFDGSGDISIATTSPTVFDNAGAHNALYRGKDITAYWDSGEMAKYIANGTFIGIYPGDYIVKSVTVDGTTYSNVKWIVGDLDYYLHRGDTETTDHHVLIFPQSPIGTAQMNTTDVTTGGYKGSKMWTTTIPLYVTAIQNAFGSTHILSHRELLTKSINTTIASGAGAGWVGCSNDWEWTSVLVNLFSENMVYGGRVLASSFFDVGECNSQISSMQLDESTSFSRTGWYWLRSVASSANFCIARNYGYADGAYASASDGLVRPYFLLY